MNATSLIETKYDLGKRYNEDIFNLLEKVLPQDVFFSEKLDKHKMVEFLNEHLPMVKWFVHSGTLSVIFLCRQRKGAAHFFYDMISRWLTPGRPLDIELFFSSDFSFPDLADVPFTVAHIALSVESDKDKEEMLLGIKSIDTEIRLGAVSNFHARRILEFKGLSPDSKTAMIQEKIGSLIQSRSQDYDKGIFALMQRFLVTCSEKFKTARDYHHISRIISILYLTRKLLNQKTQAFPNKRHFVLKFIKTKVTTDSGEMSVLGMLVGLNFLRENEVFEEKHLMGAIKTYIPGAKNVKDSFILDRNQGSHHQTIYLEIEKEDGLDFTFDEIQSLRVEMPEHLKGHIEYLTHPIFMPRNEEEVMKNMMVLSKQLRFVQDIPQVIITFDEQKGTDLSFTAIFLRVLKVKSKGIKELVKSSKMTLEKSRNVGTLRRKYPKEASVLRYHLPLKSYLRKDRSVDLYKARKDVLKELECTFGEVRDYNGGMILKQSEAFSALKKSLGVALKTNENLLEKFFYALTPVEMKTIVSKEHLKALFLLLVQFQKTSSDVLYKKDAKKLTLVMPFDDPKMKGLVLKEVESIGIASHELLHFSLDGDVPSLGFLFLTEDSNKQDLFVKRILENRCL